MFRNTSMSVAGALRRASLVRRKPAADGDSASVSEQRGKDVRACSIRFMPLSLSANAVLCSGQCVHDQQKSIIYLARLLRIFLQSTENLL